VLQVHRLSGQSCHGPDAQRRPRRQRTSSSEPVLVARGCRQSTARKHKQRTRATPPMVCARSCTRATPAARQIRPEEAQVSLLYIHERRHLTLYSVLYIHHKVFPQVYSADSADMSQPEQSCRFWWPILRTAALVVWCSIPFAGPPLYSSPLLTSAPTRSAQTSTSASFEARNKTKLCQATVASRGASRTSR
jgi:hypothetical protein